ncbi:hypothetical protein [Nocardia sp. NPDC050406]|uniref:poly(ethylene terephthalate) hydrolase family protein n=1 Tax=Nocardia sp. NPDC050406 TaxID=3364318 RepID=UPI0037A4796A
MPIRSAVIFAVVAVLALLPVGAVRAETASSVEATFTRSGPWRVTAERAVACCDPSGSAYDIWYPTDLGANGFRHPIITWGNGTWAVPRQYDYLLRHLASWGFVVIATENSQTGSGREILAAADYLVARDSDPASVFHGKLDTDSIGAMGHSQGATGVLNAMVASGGRITTAVPVEIVSQLFCVTGWCADSRQLRTGSVFFVNGSADSVVSPSTQPLPWQLVGLQSVGAYYEAASIPKAWGTLVGPNHNDIQGQPGCTPEIELCVEGVHGYLGYPTAWFAARLLGREDARRAFTTGTGEFYAPNPHWVNQTGAIN